MYVTPKPGDNHKPKKKKKSSMTLTKYAHLTIVNDQCFPNVEFPKEKGFSPFEINLQIQKNKIFTL